MRKPMERAAALPRDQRPARAALWGAAPALVAVCAVVATLLAPAGARLEVLVTGGVATLAVGLLAGETMRRGRAIAALRARLDSHLSETARLGEEVLPAAMTRARREMELTKTFDPAPESAVDPRMAELLNNVLFKVTDTLREMELQRDSGKQAIVNIANRIQAEINRMREEIGRMQFRHGSPGMLGDLMRVEHGINVAGRFAAGLAVLGGGGPVRRWTNAVSLYDVMRAGAGPINEYLRVEQQRVVEVGVRGDVVEPLIIILGELLDNATRYSPPTSMVIMNSEEVATGVEISVEDKGTGLSEEKRRRAEFLLHQGVDGIDIEDLGETARLGLRVAGILASQIKARISLRPSTCDGVRAVVFVPQDLLAPAPPLKGPSIHNPHPSVLAAEYAATAAEPAQDDMYEYERGPNGLPQRRLRRALDSTQPGPPPPPPREAEDANVPAAGPGATGEGADGVAAGEGAPAARRETGQWVEAFFAGAKSDPDGAAPAQAGSQAATTAEKEDE
ncbi:ATP-binding protein [Streptomyces sp. 6N223]|uniref:ATP-binding protein n=1 Tax=Streptomyces sp. 6N223 TaxID=3457412 RepID=UPI003FD28270